MLDDALPLALITGAARRLGAQTAQHLHAAGYNLVIHCQGSVSEAESLVDSLNTARSRSAAFVTGDLTLPGTPASLIEAAAGHSTRLDLLVNNASAFEHTPLDDADAACWDRLHAVNARAPWLLSLAARDRLRAARGAIVNIADIHAERPRADYSAYNASKASLIAVTRSLALELAPEVRVNAIAPGAILWADSEPRELQESIVGRIPLKRCGEPSDIAAAVVYLAGAPYVTGQVLNVDGGRTLMA